jgi:peptidoglycan/xylan/chitin deacetylase (PgdA/CDA1 family)
VVRSGDDAGSGRAGLSRRSFLVAAGSVVALAACGKSSENSVLGSGSSTQSTAHPAPVSTTSTSPPNSPASFVATGPTSAKRVALTFHTNGDLSLASELLAVIEQHQTPITAFVVGDWLAANPSWASRLVSAGAELANHTYTHLNFGQLPPAEMQSEIVRCRDILIQLTGSPGRLFRPSGTAEGQVNPGPEVLALAGQSGYPTVLGFDVDPLDYDAPGATVITERTLAAVHPGAIVSLHFGYPETITALPDILAGLEQRSLTPVTASTLLGAR